MHSGGEVLTDDGDGVVRVVLGVGTTIVAAAFVGFCAMGVGCLVGGSAFVEFGITSDLEDYYATIDGSDLPMRDKRRLLQRVDALSDGVHEGTVRISLFAWIQHDEQIDACLEDGVITAHEVTLIERQLDKLGRYRVD